MLSQHRNRVRRHRLSPPDRVQPFVRLGFDTDAGAVDADGRGDGAPHRTDMIAKLWPLENYGHVDVSDLETSICHQLRRTCEEVETRRTLPARIVIGEVLADVALTRAA